MFTSPIIKFLFSLLFALFAVSVCTVSATPVPVVAPGLALPLVSSPSTGGVAGSNENAASPLALLDLASLSSLPAAGGAGLPAENAVTGTGANTGAGANASPFSLLGRVVAYRDTAAPIAVQNREQRDLLAQGVGEQTLKRAERFQLRMMRRASA